MDDQAQSEDLSLFEEQERKRRFRWAGWGLALGVFLMPLGSLLDWTVYREQFEILLVSRWFVAGVLALGLILREYWCRGLLFKPVSFGLILLPGLFISWMMFVTDGGQSRYYFGLILLMFIVQFLGFGGGEAAAFCVCLLLSYVLAVSLLDGASGLMMGQAVEGVFFLFVCSIACTIGCFLSRRSRMESFVLNREIARKEAARRESMKRLQDTEQKLVHSEKMRAVAGVAAGLLHEINNPVNYASMALRVLKKRLGDSDLCETVDDVETGVLRIGEIVSDLRSFAHPEEINSKLPFRTRDAVETAIRFLTHELPEGRVMLDQASRWDDEVIGIQSQITQVILNLILNAEKATRGKSNAADRRIIVSATPFEGRMRVSVEDSGVGMNQEELSMAIQPFFTTRSGEGLGLGLGICSSIIESHGGKLVIESEPDVGTTVSFDLQLKPVEGSSPQPLMQDARPEIAVS
ncbi:MAG: HAMP domain-containing sensor histidine kinase [Planctomycetota bacterium]